MHFEDANDKEKVDKAVHDAIYGELEGIVNHITMKVFNGAGNVTELAMHAKRAESNHDANIEKAVCDALDCAGKPPLADDSSAEDKRAELEQECAVNHDTMKVLENPKARAKYSKEKLVHVLGTDIVSSFIEEAAALGLDPKKIHEQLFDILCEHGFSREQCHDYVSALVT